MTYKVYLSELANKKIRYWVDKCNKEVSGFGLVEYDKEKNEFLVTDAFLLEQTVGAAHTDIDAAALGKLMYKTRAEKGELKFWWHSHVNMDVFWSSQDQSTILDMGKNGWIVASVFNKREEVRSAVAYTASSALNDNKPETIFYDDLSTYIIKPALDADLEKQLESQYKELVKDAPVTTFKGKGGGSKSGTYDYSGWTEQDFYGGYGRGGWGYDERDEWNDYYKRTENIAKGNIMSSDGASKSDEGYFTMNSETLPDREVEMIIESGGAFGYGFKEEAAVLGLSHKAYRRIIKRNDVKHDAYKKCTFNQTVINY
jgi:hypothetical protein